MQSKIIIKEQQLSFLQFSQQYSQNSHYNPSVHRPSSIVSRQSKSILYSKVLTKSSTVSSIDGDPAYEILNFTYTFIIQQLNIGLSLTVFSILILLRYYTLFCLIYVVVKKPQQWEWIFVVIAPRFVYFVLVMKISLKNAETKTQIILKTHWNSKQTGIYQMFEVTDGQKLRISLIRAIIPSQLSFLYIKTKSKKKTVEIYGAINYIYASIEFLLYYPLFIVYCTAIDRSEYTLTVIDPAITIFVSCVAELILIILSIYLGYIGWKRKYGHFLPF